MEDAETDSDSPEYRKRYKFSKSNVIALPDAETVNSRRIKKGRRVLALYPDTSCFYEAKVLDGPLSV